MRKRLGGRPRRLVGCSLALLVEMAGDDAVDVTAPARAADGCEGACASASDAWSICESESVTDCLIMISGLCVLLTDNTDRILFGEFAIYVHLERVVTVISFRIRFYRFIGAI